jgi:hypothetical protein
MLARAKSGTVAIRMDNYFAALRSVVADFFSRSARASRN